MFCAPGSVFMTLQNSSLLFPLCLFFPFSQALHYPFILLNFATCTYLSNTLILMLTVTIATLFRVLPNKPGVIPTRSAVGLERRTTKHHNMFVCVVELSPPTETENSGHRKVGQESTRDNISLKCSKSVKRARNMSVSMWLYVSVCLPAQRNTCVTRWHIISYFLMY